jgi:hypothetical protein
MLRAGHTDYVINDAALADMRDRALAGPVIRQLAAHPHREFGDEAAWQRHLKRLGIDGSENDIRCQVTKRQISGGTKSDIGRDCRDAFLGSK